VRAGDGGRQARVQRRAGHHGSDSDETLDWCDRLVRTVERTGLSYMLGRPLLPPAGDVLPPAAAGDFGAFTYAEGEYFHGYNDPLRPARGAAPAAGQQGRQEWAKIHHERYVKRGILDAPMHYPRTPPAAPSA